MYGILADFPAAAEEAGDYLFGFSILLVVLMLITKSIVDFYTGITWG
jgi:hypothetical protein